MSSVLLLDRIFRSSEKIHSSTTFHGIRTTLAGDLLGASLLISSCDDLSNIPKSIYSSLRNKPPLITARAHRLIKLWDDLTHEDRTAIAARTGEIRNRTQGTKLGDAGTATSADEIVRTHKVTFVHARCYMETRENASTDPVLNVDLWQFALAAYMHARHDITSADSSTT